MADSITDTLNVDIHIAVRDGRNVLPAAIPHGSLQQSMKSYHFSDPVVGWLFQKRELAEKLMSL
ncbi:MAG: hypothetical protein E7G60_08245 [Pantoea sp.]|nr:hypothetical protein [Pantoea sp.]